MVAAYLFHAVNIAVAILLVPLLLRHLDAAEYALWLIFMAFGGATLHLQNALQSSSVREIARGVHLGDGLDLALQRMRTAYAGLAAFVAIPLFGIGLSYLSVIGAMDYRLEWSVFILSYALLYAIAPNFSVLLSTDRVTTCNNINTLTRALYLVGVVVFLNLDLSILGLCIAFAISTLATAILSTYATRYHNNPPWKWSISPNIAPFALFAVSGFTLYNGSLLIAAPHFSREIIATYGLGLQMSTLLYTVSLAPLPVWLARLMRAIASGEERKELLRNVVGINLLFAFGALILLMFGSKLLVLIDSRIPLPGRLDLILFAFAVEMNIAVLVNFLMAKGNYQFVRVYVPIAVTGIVGGAVAGYITNNIYSFIVVPVCLQSVLCLPLIARIVFAELSKPPDILSSSEEEAAQEGAE